MGDIKKYQSVQSMFPVDVWEWMQSNLTAIIDKTYYRSGRTVSEIISLLQKGIDCSDETVVDSDIEILRVSVIKAWIFDRIDYNISVFGYHVAKVNPNGNTPDFCYTVGLSEKYGFELIGADIDISITVIQEILRENDCADEAPDPVDLLDVVRTSKDRCFKFHSLHVQVDINNVKEGMRYSIRPAPDSYLEEFAIEAFKRYPETKLLLVSYGDFNNKLPGEEGYIPHPCNF